MNKHFNCIRNPKYSKEKLEEDLIWPTEKITDEDVVKIFEKLMIYYKENLKEESEEKTLKIEEEKWKKKIGIVPKMNNLLVTKVQGDFWKGNLEKDKMGCVWFFDWEFSQKRILLWDFINYFLIEYVYTKKINKKIFIKIKKLFLKNFQIKKNEFNRMIELVFIIHKKVRLKSQEKKLNRFYLSLKNNF